MSNTSTNPENFNCRSFIYRKFKSSQVIWTETNNYGIASSITDPTIESDYVQQLAICDLSYLQRTGFKGAGACEWLKNQNINIPTGINHTLSNDDGCLIARLGINDILIFDSLKNQTNLPIKLEQQWQHDYAPGNKPCGFIVPRQDSHACFSVTGEYAPEMFAKLCAIDLRVEKFANNMIAQTSLARLSAIIIRRDLNAFSNYLVLVESASAEYCWDCLLDSMQEFNGQIVGTSILATFSK